MEANPARFDSRKVEIISADSRAIYKCMDIGTAKPSAVEQTLVPHFGLDLVFPGARFTVYDFKKYALSKISEIIARGNIPLVVGGTGLYIDALIYDYQFSEQKNCSDRTGVGSDFLVFGIKWEREKLRERLALRTEEMFGPELYEETLQLVSQYGWENQAMKSNIYQFVWKYMQNEITLEEAKRLNTLDDYHLAKRQMTWFKRNEEIKWFPLDKIVENVLKCIQYG